MAKKEKVETLPEPPEPIERTPTSLNIHQRINAVMAEWTYVKKTKEIKNKAGVVMFKVVGHDDVTALVHPLLVKHGINVMPSQVDLVSQVLKVDYYGKEQIVNRERLEVIFEWVNIDKPEDIYKQRWIAYGVDDSDKGPGKAMTYAQRGAVLKTLHIETGEQEPEATSLEQKERAEEIRKEVREMEYQAAIDKAKGDGQDIPLPDGTKVSDGTTLSADLQVQVKKAFARRKIGTDDQRKYLDVFMVDSIMEILNSDYEELINNIINPATNENG